jgi:acetyl esterase
VALDADTAQLLESLVAAGAPPLTAGTPAEARAQYDAAPKPPPDPVHRVFDAAVPGPAGAVPVRVYADSDDTGLPVLAFFHGGGWVMSSVDGHDSLARRLATRTGALVVSVDYRLAPEHPYPAAHDDCWAVTAWLAAHAAEWGGDPGRIAVAGDSAGGNLAAGVALRARDQGRPLRFQLLIYPCLDVAGEYPSMVDNGSGYFLTADDMQWFWDQYVPPEHRRDPYAVPMRATSLAGLPPTLIQTAEYDPLRDEGEAWGGRLAADGVPVVVTRYPGVVHGFVSRWTAMARAEAAHDEAAAALAAAFAP